MGGGTAAGFDGAIGGWPAAGGAPAGGWLCDQFHVDPAAAGGGWVPGCTGAAGGG